MKVVTNGDASRKMQAYELRPGRFFRTDAGDVWLSARLGKAVNFADGSTPVIAELKNFSNPVTLLPESFTVTLGGV